MIQLHVAYFYKIGPKPGDTLAIDRTQANANLHKVVYTAVDSGGLEAIPCTFTVIVAGKVQLNSIILTRLSKHLIV